MPGAVHTCAGSQKCAQGSHGSSGRVAGQELGSSQEPLGTMWGQLLTFSLCPCQPMGHRCLETVERLLYPAVSLKWDSRWHRDGPGQARAAGMMHNAHEVLAPFGNVCFNKLSCRGGEQNTGNLLGMHRCLRTFPNHPFRQFLETCISEVFCERIGSIHT